MTFQPQFDSLKNILELLERSKNGPSESNNEVQAFLNNFNLVPEFNCYLMYITAHLTVDLYEHLHLQSLSSKEASIETSRALSAIMLKNNVLNAYKNISPFLDYIQKESISCLGDNQLIIRNVTSSLIATIIQADH
jgi:hypothetical protein